MESKQRGEGGQWHTGRWSMAGDPRSRSARSLAFSCSSFPFPPLFLSCTLHCTVWAAPALLVLCSVVPPVNMTPPKGTNTVKTPQKKGQCRSSLAKGKCELESGDVEWTTGVASPIYAPAITRLNKEKSVILGCRFTSREQRGRQLHAGRAPVRTHGRNGSCLVSSPPRLRRSFPMLLGFLRRIFSGAQAAALTGEQLPLPFQSYPTSRTFGACDSHEPYY